VNDTLFLLQKVSSDKRATVY